MVTVMQKVNNCLYQPVSYYYGYGLELLLL
jgi:hypothetical protein